MMNPDKLLDGVRHIWDVSSLSDLTRCPAYYNYRNNHNIIGEATLHYKPREDTSFGHAYHDCLEQYNLQISEHHDQERAVHHAVRHAIRTYQSSFTGDSTTYTLANLVRTIVWYDHFFSTNPFNLAFIEGNPALESRFEVPYGTKRLSGRTDGLVFFNDNLYILERKTRRAEVTDQYLASYLINYQVYDYVIALRSIGLPIVGICVEVASVLVNSTRFRRMFIDFMDKDKRLDEHQHHVLHFLDQADTYYRRDFWPQNPVACTAYGGVCPYLYLCTAEPEMREQLMESSIHAEPKQTSAPPTNASNIPIVPSPSTPNEFILE